MDDDGNEASYFFQSLAKTITGYATAVGKEPPHQIMESLSQYGCIGRFADTPPWKTFRQSGLQLIYGN